MRWIRTAAFGLSAFVAGCSTGADDALTELLKETAGALAQGNPAASNITATRASLTALGFDQPLIVVSLPEAGTRGGLLRQFDKEGVTFWRTADEFSTMRFEAGVLRGTTGLGHDLYGVDTKATRAALTAGAQASSLRSYRVLNGEGVLHVQPYTCTLFPKGRETIEVFDRSHAVIRFSEICTAHGRDLDGERRRLENTYWRDVSRPVVWKSRQWVSPNLGYMTVERVFE